MKNTIEPRTVERARGVLDEAIINLIRIKDTMREFEAYKHPENPFNNLRPSLDHLDNLVNRTKELMIEKGEENDIVRALLVSTQYFSDLCGRRHEEYCNDI